MHHPRARGLDDAGITEDLSRLSEAQLVVARELGLPSWPRLKDHALGLRRARESIASGAGAPDGDAGTLHVRCGSDLRDPLREAGFAGGFLEYSDPLCQGPVVSDGDWLACRAAFVARAYGVRLGQDGRQVAAKLEEAEAALRDGLGLTERLVLHVLSEGSRTAAEVFALVQDREPLPWLGDAMLLHILDDMGRAREPVFTEEAEDQDLLRPDGRLTITPLGRAVRGGEADWLSLLPPERWLGGVRIDPAAACWRWDDRAGMPVPVPAGAA